MSEGHNPPNSAGEPAQDHTANARPRKYISEDEYEMQAAVTTRAELSNLSSTLTDGNAIKRAVQYSTTAGGLWVFWRLECILWSL